MRVILFLLLFLNLSVAAWYLLLAPKPIMESRPFSAKVDALKLVSERADEGSLEPTTLASVENSSEGLLGSPSVEVLIPNNELAELEEEAGSEALMDVTEPVSIPKIVVLKSCFSIGPFIGLETVKRAASTLEERQIEVAQRELNERYLSSYQVYLSALPSLSKAKQVTKELKQKKIRDYYIILKRGAQRYAISLGLFKDKKHAVRRMALLKKRGFQPKMLSRFRTRQLYWLDYTGGAEPIDLVMLQGKEENTLQRLERACN